MHGGPSVSVELSNGQTAELVPGDLIGRLPTASLSINDPRISEAHALVSLRGSQMKLLALRGGLRVGVGRLLEVTLRPGLEVELADGVSLQVRAVDLPQRVLAVRLDEGPPLVLARVTALLAGPPPRLSVRPSPEAVALLWTHQSVLWVRPAGGVDFALAPGASATVGATALHVQLLDLADQAQPPTQTHAEVLHFVVWYDSVRVSSPGCAPLLVDGMPARVLSELVLLGGPVAWEVVAKEVWGGEVPRPLLRERFDATLARLRRRFADHGIRRPLLRASQTGQIELLLTPQDTVESHA